MVTPKIIKAGEAPADAVLACYRIADVASPRVPSVQARCDGCDARIWVALSSPNVRRKICLQCAIEEAKAAGDDPTLLATEIQMADAKKHAH